MLNNTIGYNGAWLSSSKFMPATEAALDFCPEQNFELDFDLSPGSVLDFEREEEGVPEFAPNEPLNPEDYRTDACSSTLRLDLDFPDLDLASLDSDLDLPELGMDLYCLDLDLEALDQELDWDNDNTEMETDETPALEDDAAAPLCHALAEMRQRPALKQPVLSSRAVASSASNLRRTAPAPSAGESEIILTVPVRGLTLGGAVSTVACAIRKRRTELEADIQTAEGKHYRWRFLGLYNNNISYRAELIRSARQEKNKP